MINISKVQLQEIVIVHNNWVELNIFYQIKQALLHKIKWSFEKSLSKIPSSLLIKIKDKLKLLCKIMITFHKIFIVNKNASKTS